MLLITYPTKPSIPIPGPPRTHKASYTHLRPSTTNKSPSHLYQVLNTHPFHPHYSLALYAHPRSSTQVPGSPHPSQTFRTSIGHPDVYRHLYKHTSHDTALSWCGGFQIGVNGWGWVWRGSGWPMVVGKVWNGYEVLGWVRRAWDLGGGPRMGVKG